MTTFRDLPSVDRLLGALGAQTEQFGRQAVVSAARAALDEARGQIRAGTGAALSESSIHERALALLAETQRPSLRPVINLTGTLVHTNLGRAVLPESARAAVAQVASEACNLEYDVDAGRRGDRDSTSISS